MRLGQGLRISGLLEGYASMIRYGERKKEKASQVPINKPISFGGIMCIKINKCERIRFVANGSGRALSSQGDMKSLIYIIYTLFVKGLKDE